MHDGEMHHIVTQHQIADLAELGNEALIRFFFFGDLIARILACR